MELLLSLLVCESVRDGSRFSSFSLLSDSSSEASGVRAPVNALNVGFEVAMVYGRRAGERSGSETVLRFQSGSEMSLLTSLELLFRL